MWTSRRYKLLDQRYTNTVGTNCALGRDGACFVLCQQPVASREAGYSQIRSCSTCRLQQAKGAAMEVHFSSPDADRSIRGPASPRSARPRRIHYQSLRIINNALWRQFSQNAHFRARLNAQRKYVRDLYRTAQCDDIFLADNVWR